MKGILLRRSQLRSPSPLFGIRLVALAVVLLHKETEVLGTNSAKGQVA